MVSNLESKINRIATAVTSALSALTAKGVTVPEGANVESLAALIESIEAGGGGFENIKIATGSFTPASLTVCPEQSNPTADAFTVEHNAGFVPRAVIAYTDEFKTSNLTLYAAVVKGLYASNSYLVSASAVYKYYSNNKFKNDTSIRTHNSTWNDSVFVIGIAKAEIQLAAGKTINWVVFS